MNLLKPISGPHTHMVFFLTQPPFSYTRDEAQSMVDRCPIIIKKKEKAILKTFEILNKNFPIWGKDIFYDNPKIISYSQRTITEGIDALTLKQYDTASIPVQNFIKKAIPPWLYNMYHKNPKNKGYQRKSTKKFVDKIAEVQIGLAGLGFSHSEIERIISKMYYKNSKLFEDFQSFESFMRSRNIEPTEYSREKAILSLGSTRWEAFKKPLDFFVKNGADNTAIKNYLKHSITASQNYTEREMYAVLNYMAYLGRDIRNNYLGKSAYDFFRNNNIALEEITAAYGPKEGEEVPKIEIKNYAQDVFFEIFETEGFSKEQTAALWEKHGDIFNTDGCASNRLAVTESIQLLKGRNLTTDEIFECYIKNKRIMSNTYRLLKMKLGLIDEISAFFGKDVLRQTLHDACMKGLNENTITNIKKWIEVNDKKKDASVRQLIKYAYRYGDDKQVATPKPEKIEKFSILNTGDAETNEKIKNARVISFNINEKGGLQ